MAAARQCCPPQWAIGAGALRNLVWNRLTGRRNPPADVDVVFFGDAQETAVEECLRRCLPEVPWQAKDQALVHIWYERVFGFRVEPLTSLTDAVATWPETCTSVAVSLSTTDVLSVIAPHGLDDLFGLVLCRNPRRVTVEIFRRRLEEKRISERWPEVTVVDG